MDDRGFRVVLDFSEFFTDERRRSYMYIENVPKKTVFDLQCRIRKLFRIKDEICLLADGCFLHPQETVFVLYEEDVVKVIRSGPTGKNSVEEKEEESKQEGKTLKRKRERGKDSEKAEDGSPRSRWNKSKKYDKQELFNDVDCDKTSADKATKLTIHTLGEGSSLRSTNQIESLVEYESEIAANDSIQGYKKKIRRKKNRKAHLKETPNMEKEREETCIEECSIDMNVSASPVANSSEYLDSGVAVSGEVEAETQSIEKELARIASLVEPTATPSADEVGIKRKRRRKHKKKKKDANAESGPSLSKANCSPQKYSLSGWEGTGKHIKFADESEEDKEAEEDASGFGTPNHKESPAIKSESQGDVISLSDIKEEMMNRINAFIQIRQECNRKMPSNTSPQQEVLETANAFKSPHTQWDVKSSSSAGGSQLCGGIFNPPKISTPLVFECKRPIVTTESPVTMAQNGSEASPQHSKQNAEKYSEYPLLQGTPRDNDVLAFKVWKLGEDYSPGISNYIVGKVLIFSEPEKRIKLKILRGHAELKEPNGKFSIDKRSEQEDDDEEIIDLEEPVIDELETDFGQMLEVRVLFP